MPEKELLFWLLKSHCPGRKVLDFLCELTLEWISSSFAILDREKVESYVRSEMTSLLYKVGTGLIEVGDGLGYFFSVRLGRLVRNLLRKKAIEPLDLVYFSDIEGRVDGKNRGEDFVERFLALNEDETHPGKTEEGKGKNGSCKQKTLLRAFRIEATKEFYPGCFRTGSYDQKPLF